MAKRSLMSLTCKLPQQKWQGGQMWNSMEESERVEIE